MPKFIKIFKNLDIWQMACGWLFIIAIVTTLYLHREANINIQILSNAGGFLSGTLGSVFGIITIMILLLERQENKNRNNIDSSFKIYENYKIILEKGLDRIVYSREAVNGRIDYRGLEAFRKMSESPISIMTDQDSYRILIQLDDHAKHIKRVYDFLKNQEIVFAIFESNFEDHVTVFYKLSKKLLENPTQAAVLENVVMARSINKRLYESAGIIKGETLL